MSLLSRMKRALKARANAAIDKAVNPEKELAMAIAELEEAEREAKKELLSYKTTAKQIERDIAAADAKIESWQKRAVEAVKAGNDELAKEALTEKRRLEADRKQMMADRNEAAGYAIELNKSRKQVEVRLRILKLKQGTLAQQIAAARSASGSPFGGDELWERMQVAEDAIDEQAIAAEVNQMLGIEEGERAMTADQVSADTSALDADDQLQQLKAKMAEQKRKQLGGKSNGE